MQKWKQALKTAFVLPLWACAPIALPAAAWLAWVFAAGLEETAFGYGSFAFSAYALTVCCASLPASARHWRKNRLWQSALRLPAVQKYQQDPLFRTDVSLRAGLCVNIAYALLKGISGIVYRSEWFGALALYYILLSALRLGLARKGLRNAPPAAQWRTYRNCGGVLLLMNQALAVVTGHVVVRAESFAYPGYLVYAMAAYTFYAVISAVIQAYKTRRHTSPVLTAAKTTTLVAALVSLLSLETALLAQFGDPAQETFRRIMTAATGAAVCTVVLAMAVYMLARGTKELRQGR